MAYHRFLTNKDYCCIATEEHMKQLIRDVPERFPQAEHRAEMQLLEYLDQYYEIEKILAVGKNIREYSPYVSYPGQAWIKKDEEIFKTLMHINGYKKPTKIEYWRQVVDFIDPRLIDHAHKYSQLRTYPKGEIVRFGTEYWQCMVPHGYESGEIHMPGVKAWREAEITPWEPNMEWEKNQVCSFNDQFYQYLGNDESEEPEETPEPFPEEPEPTEPSIDDDSEISTQNEEGEEEIGEGDEEPVPTPDLPADETVLTPEEDDCWGLIGDYSEELEYDYSEGAFDYVVAEGTVFYPVFNPNPDELIEGVNITRDDPRNANVVAHMSRMALYHLHSIISATNIPETRRWAYEDSIQWLYNASKFKINPQLPRKRERDSCAPKVDWALETFQRSYDPEQNPWLI
ncbi:hypothetical protein [uncultured Bacteroides sp.]|nr:hypothetical protein [uncultured Bacteroides sp.]ROS80277.1 hypothetical protein EEK90_14970 [Muribaculaceae bacterium Isolate-036 (Harlan)]